MGAAGSVCYSEGEAGAALLQLRRTLKQRLERLVSQPKGQASSVQQSRTSRRGRRSTGLLRSAGIVNVRFEAVWHAHGFGRDGEGFRMPAGCDVAASDGPRPKAAHERTRGPRAQLAGTTSAQVPLAVEARQASMNARPSTPVQASGVSDANGSGASPANRAATSWAKSA